ncbi:MAG: tubulin-like doman-containing protein [Anaerolineae bacterium]|jgi:hypothetical protein|nr:tubulin-like doman-containing protein [Anaerolineae bacterium]
MEKRANSQTLPDQQVETLLPADLRPTLVIGLGGTGQRIILHLKGQLLRAYGEVPERYIRLLCFDTATEALSIMVDGEAVTLEQDREFFHIGHTPVPNIIRNLEHQSAIASRLPSIQSIPAVALRNGARQLRPLGLLALLWRFDEVEQRLSNAIWTLAGKDSLGRREGQTQGINVFICNSLVGGTGSGMFLDVAYLVRALFAELGSMGDFCYITGVGVLPQVFHGIEGPNLVPNAIAALKELSHCMLRGGFVNQYPNGRHIEAPYPPFDIYYLVDGVDEQGYTWQGVGDLAAMIAAGLFLQIGSQVGLKGENDFDNLSDVLSRQSADGEGTFCGSFGMATLRFPASDIAAWCTARLAERIIAQGLLQPADSTAILPKAAGFLQAELPEVEGFLKALSQDDQGAPLLVDPGTASWLQGGRSTTPAEVIRYIHDYQHARIQGDYRTWIKSNGKAISERLAQGLDAYALQLLSDPEVSIEGTLVALGLLNSLLTERSSKVESRREAANSASQQLSVEMTSQEEALRQAAGGFFLWKGHALVIARDRYLEIATAALSQQLETYVCDVALTTLAELNHVVTRWQRLLERVKAALMTAERQFGQEKETFAQGQKDHKEIADISLTDPAYCELLYERYAPPLSQVLAELLREHNPAEWGESAIEEIINALREVAARAFEPLQAMTIEDALQDQHNEISPGAYRERLFRLAAPSWNLDLTRLEDGGAYLKTVQVLGVPDEAQSLYRDQMQMLVSTHNPTTITAFAATLGAPFSALQQYPDYVRSYQSARRNRVLHILAQFQSEDEQAQLAFALGIIYEMIFNRGFYFYYQPEDALDPPVKLDNGLANAIRRFAQSETLVQEVLTRVELRIAGMGTTAALEKLAAYYTSNGKDKEPGITDSQVIAMRKLVRAYAEELRSTQQAFGAN